jgi:hypothetical protein
VVIKTNSRNNDEFVFTVRGNSYIKMPQITLSQDTTSIENYEEYDFGIVAPTESKSVVFTIGNSGEAPLTFTNVNNNRITLTDNAAGLFTVTQQPAASITVTPGNTTSFTVRFSPVGEGSFSATVTIKTNSKADDEFTFAINGSSAMSTSDITNIAYSGAWTLESDGRYKTNTTGHSGQTSMRINFTAIAGATLTIQLDVSSESGYDYAFINPLDEYSSTSYYSGSRISGQSSTTVNMLIPTAGNHAVNIWYIKDSSGSADSDCAWFKVFN